MQTNVKGIYVRNIEADVFMHSGQDLLNLDNEPLPAGWYWRPVYPVSLADSVARGPFSSEREAAVNCVSRVGN